MDPNFSEYYDQLEWQIIEENIMDNTKEEFMRLIHERQGQQQSNDSAKCKCTKMVIDGSYEQGHKIVHWFLWNFF